MMMKRIDEIADNNPFRVPNNYFEEVNSKIISSTAGAGIEKVRPRISTRLRPYMAAAATVAVLAMLGYATLKILVFPEDAYLIPEISMQEFSYTYLNDIDIVTLEEAADPLLFSEDFPEVSKSEIIDYLILENIDINEIFELL